MPFAFYYPHMPYPSHYSGGAAAPTPPQLPAFGAGRGHDFVASNAHGGSAPATSAAPAAAPAPAAVPAPAGVYAALRIRVELSLTLYLYSIRL